MKVGNPAAECYCRPVGWQRYSTYFCDGIKTSLPGDDIFLRTIPPKVASNKKQHLATSGSYQRN